MSTDTRKRPEITVETELSGYTRLRNSVNGAGRYRLHTTDPRSWRVSASACDADLHAIVRSLGDDESARVRLTATPSGRVWKIERL